jgi:DNA-binding PadR family transcriptional regulator
VKRKMKAYRVNLERMRVILLELSRGSVCRTGLEKRFVKKTSGSPATFEATFRFLVEDGCIEKCGFEHRAPFRITEKGKAFLAWRAHE